MYDGSTATAEAVLMARRLTRKDKIILSGGLHPHYRDVVRTYLDNSPSLICLSASPEGQGDILDRIDDETAAIVIQTPDFYGHLRDVKRAADAIHAKGGAADRRRHRSGLARPARSARRARRRYRRVRGPVDRQCAQFRRPLCRA